MAEFSSLKWRGKAHHHGCTRCNRRYEDACVSPEENGICNACRTGRDTARELSWAPSACCPDRNRLANKHDREALKLAGPGPWWVCLACARSFPFQPEEQ